MRAKRELNSGLLDPNPGALFNYSKTEAITVAFVEIIAYVLQLISLQISNYFKNKLKDFKLIGMGKKV